MFACVHWDGDGFDDRVIATLPDQNLWCYFLPAAIVFRVPSMGAFVDTRARLSAMAAADGEFTFALDLHTERDSFGGHAYFELPPEYSQITA